MVGVLLWMALWPAVMTAHDAHGRSNAPAEARRLKNPQQGVATTEEIRALYGRECASCHGTDGKASTALAGKLPVRPTNLTNYLMESMRDGEIYWVVTHGIDGRMPAFEQKITETDRWLLVSHVRALRAAQKIVELQKLGPYEWNLPPGFPFPNVPPDNPMTKEKVELGRYLFYDKRLSFNRTQSCGTCHQQKLAFADARGRGLGSTGEQHPRGPMSLANVAYGSVLTWGNPNVRQLEPQALVPLFGDLPVELGMTGKEELLLQRLRSHSRYQKMFPAAFPSESDPFTIANITRAIASFERTILSGDSPYDRYRLGDDPNAISESAKRGEKLFFSEKLECFHCHGGFAFTGSVDYLDKGFPEVEFHNTGLYNRKGKWSYPEQNRGLYEFTRNEADVGKFKAPTLRNIALTKPYMHDGSVATLEEAIEHYAAGGRTIRTGPHAGIGADNPNKSEFVKGFELGRQEKLDLLEFLHSLTDETLLHDPRLSDPWTQAVTRRAPAKPKNVLTGEVVAVYPEDGAITLYHDEVPGLITAMKPPHAMEFQVADRAALKPLKRGQRVTASVRKQGSDYILDDLRPVKP